MRPDGLKTVPYNGLGTVVGHVLQGVPIRLL